MYISISRWTMNSLYSCFSIACTLRLLSDVKTIRVLNSQCCTPVTSLNATSTTSKLHPFIRIQIVLELMHLDHSAFDSLALEKFSILAVTADYSNLLRFCVLECLVRTAGCDLRCQVVRKFNTFCSSAFVPAVQ